MEHPPALPPPKHFTLVAFFPISVFFPSTCALSNSLLSLVGWFSPRSSGAGSIWPSPGVSALMASSSLSPQIRCMLNIWGVILYLRLPWITAQAGIGGCCSSPWAGQWLWAHHHPNTLGGGRTPREGWGGWGMQE